MDNENFYINAIKKTYLEIDFVRKFEKILIHTSFENRLTKIDKKEILNRLKSKGYNFSVFNPGRDFYIENESNEIRFIFSFNVNGGIVLPYIYIYVNNEKVSYDYSNLVFNYKYLIGNLELLMDPATIFRDYDEFQEILSELLDIYEDFKKKVSNENKK